MSSSSPAPNDPFQAVDWELDRHTRITAATMVALRIYVLIKKKESDMEDLVRMRAVTDRMVESATDKVARARTREEVDAANELMDEVTVYVEQQEEDVAALAQMNADIINSCRFYEWIMLGICLRVYLGYY